MAESALEVVQEWADGMRRGALGSELWHPDCEIVNARGWVVDVTYRGRAGLERWWLDIAEAFTDFEMVIETVEPVGDDRVFTAQRMVGKFRTSDIPVDAPWCSVFTVRDGMIARAVGYLTQREAREALAAGA